MYSTVLVFDNFSPLSLFLYNKTNQLLSSVNPENRSLLIQRTDDHSCLERCATWIQSLALNLSICCCTPIRDGDDGVKWPSISLPAVFPPFEHKTPAVRYTAVRCTRYVTVFTVTYNNNKRQQCRSPTQFALTDCLQKNLRTSHQLKTSV